MSDELPDNDWQTVCDFCRQWVTGIFHVTLDGQRACIECAAMMGVETGLPTKKIIPVGPPAPEGSACDCGTAAVAQCQCGATFCEPCWHRHSHTTTFPVRHDAPSDRPESAPMFAGSILPLLRFDEQWRYLWLGIDKWVRLTDDDDPCPICRSLGSCAAGPDGRVWCVNVESWAGARDRAGRRGWVHHVKRPRRRGVAA